MSKNYRQEHDLGNGSSKKGLGAYSSQLHEDMLEDYSTSLLFEMQVPQRFSSMIFIERACIYSLVNDRESSETYYVLLVLFIFLH